MLAAVFAQMMDRGDMDGGGGHWWWWLIGLTVMVLLVVLVVMVVIRASAPAHPAPPTASPRSSAEEVLAERFARGEIDEDEYRRRRDALRG